MTLLGMFILVVFLVAVCAVIYVAFNYREACERWAAYFIRRMGFFIILFCISSASAQDAAIIDPYLEDEDSPIIILPDKPVIFPEALPKAADVIVQIVEAVFCPPCADEEAAIQAKNRAFLGNCTGNISINFTA